MANGSRPWWADDPEIIARRRAVEEELERASHEPITPDGPDLERARGRYEDAVRNARTVGQSWGEIGRILGVSKQLLHRRFSGPAGENLPH
jgi:hypothetical protein